MSNSLHVDCLREKIAQWTKVLSQKTNFAAHVRVWTCKRLTEILELKSVPRETSTAPTWEAEEHNTAGQGRWLWRGIEEEGGDCTASRKKSGMGTAPVPALRWRPVAMVRRWGRRRCRGWEKLGNLTARNQIPPELRFHVRGCSFYTRYLIGIGWRKLVDTRNQIYGICWRKPADTNNLLYRLAYVSWYPYAQSINRQHHCFDRAPLFRLSTTVAAVILKEIRGGQFHWGIFTLSLICFFPFLPWYLNLSSHVYILIEIYISHVYILIDLGLFPSIQF
jgi:hypothetical protein